MTLISSIIEIQCHGADTFDHQLLSSPTIPSYRRRYEKLLSDNDWQGYIWKSCQHYTCWLDDRIPPPYGIPWSAQIGCGHPPQYMSRKGFDWRVSLTEAGFTSAYGNYGAHISGLPSLTQVDVGDGFVPRPLNLTWLKEQSLRAMLPTIKSELSLVNSILELKDLRSLPGSLRKLTSFLEGLPAFITKVKNVVKLKRGMRRIRSTFSASTPTIREALGVGADSYLSNEFGILPVLSDISGVSRALSRTERKINDLLVRQGRRQRKHFSVKFYPPSAQYYAADKTANIVLEHGQFAGWDDLTPFMSVRRQNDCGLQFVREVASPQIAEFHAQIEYNYHFTRFQTEHAQLLGLLDTLGVNLNPAIIWNALPWTFLLDWVTNVSKWLDDRKVLNMEPTINITRYLWSCKTIRTTRLKLRSFISGPNYPFRVPWTYLPDLHEMTYRRQVEMPDKPSLLATSGLSSHELTLGVALAITQRRRFFSRGSR